MITKWTSVKSVLFELERRIPKDIYSEPRLIEDCMRAVDFIGAVPTYQQKVKFMKVEDYKACLPNECLQIIQIAHKNDFCLSNTDILALAETAHACNSECVDCTDESVTFDINDVVSQTIINSNSFYRNWTALSLSTNSFALSVHCDNCVNLRSSCNYEYSVSPDGILTFNFQTGYICISYYAYPKDCDGTFLIPDVEDYKQALVNYCMMNAWQFRWELKEEGSGERYKEYQMLWSLFKSKATASIRMPDLASAEAMKNISLKLIPNNRRFDTFFRNLGSSENLDMNGYSNGSLYRN